MKRLWVSAENAEFQVIRALKTNRVKRSKAGEVFIEGTECVKQAVKAKLELTRIITAEGTALSGWARDLIRGAGTASIITMAPRLFGELCDRDTPPELIVTAKIESSGLSEMPEPASPFIVLFDRPGDRGNLGSVIRTANSFNVDMVLIMGHGVDVYEPKVIRASLGSVFHTRVAAAPSMEALGDFIARKKAQTNMTVVGTDSAGALSIGRHPGSGPGGRVLLKRPVMLVIGNEAKGMSAALKELCDAVVRIPIGGAVNSLNAACAASIVMWEVYRNSVTDTGA